MPEPWRYRGRVVTAEDVVFIRDLIAQQPGLSRRRLSEKLCEAWQWQQANGVTRVVCDTANVASPDSGLTLFPGEIGSLGFVGVILPKMI